jgi:hypothetical protein|tara:strand:+ start:643 stop:897 length:255 start_codon:yes stop_codon:yes gene_type:complete
MKYFLVTILSLIFLSCASADKSMQASEEKEENSKDDLICKFEEMTGSHVRKRVCYTQRQIDRQREISQEALRRRIRGVPSNPNP